MKKKFLLLATMTVMSMSFLTACQGGKTNDSANEASAEILPSTIAAAIQTALMDPGVIASSAPGAVSDVELSTIFVNRPEFKQAVSENLGVDVDTLKGYYVTIGMNQVTVTQGSSASSQAENISESTGETISDAIPSTIATAIQTALLDPAMINCSVPGEVSDAELSTIFVNCPEFKQLVSENLGVDVDTLKGYYVTIEKNRVTVVQK